MVPKIFYNSKTAKQIIMSQIAEKYMVLMQFFIVFNIPIHY